jgi:uncharacterized membrane protein
MTTDLTFVFTVFAIGLATYGTRLAGYWLLQGREVTGRLKAAMDAVPPAILVGVIAPTVFLGGTANMIAGAATLGAALLRLPLLLTITIGVAVAALARLVIT